MIKKFFGSLVIQIFCVLWAVFLFLDYLNYSSYFIDAFRYLEYTSLIVTVLILTAAITYLFSNKKWTGATIEIRNYRGIYHYAFVLLLMTLVMSFYLAKTNIVPGAASGTFVFLIKTILLHIGFLVILLAALNSGTFILNRMSVQIEEASFVLVSIAVGFVVITLGLFLLGITGLLYQFIVIPFILLLLIPGWRGSLSRVQPLVFKKSLPFKIHLLGVFSYAFLLFLVAICLTFISRPYPIGYDSLSLYMNTSKLVAGYHALTTGGDAYNWSLMMSLGFIMFKNTTISLLISVVPGILCLFAIYRICINLQINRNWALFACALYYSLPNTIWQSKNDEKTDLALLFITLCSFLLFLAKNSGNKINLKPSGWLGNYLNKIPDGSIWLLCGLLMGYAFGIKYVAMLTIFAYLVLIFYKNSGKTGAIATFFLMFFIIYWFDLTKYAAFEKDLFRIRAILPFLLALGFYIYTFRKNKTGLLISARTSFIFLFALGVIFLPWAIKNISENKKVSVGSMLTGKSSLKDLYTESKTTTGQLQKPGTDSITLENDEDFKGEFLAGFSFSDVEINAAKQFAQFENKRQRLFYGRRNLTADKPQVNAEKQEEIRRYLGYEPGIIRFISLPYDIVMKTNVRLASTEAGILLLIIMPVFIFVFAFQQLPWNILKMTLMLFLLIVSMISVDMVDGTFDLKLIFDELRTLSFQEDFYLKGIFLPVFMFMKKALLVMGSWIFPVYHYLTLQRLGVSFILLVAFSIPIYFLYRNSFKGLDFHSKSLIAFVFCVIQYWIILSSGIVWYGIVGFSLIPAVIALLVTRGEQNGESGNFLKKFVAICSFIWFVIILPYQFMPIRFLNESDISKINFKEFMDAPFVKYAVGAQDERQVFKQFFYPAQQNIINTLNRDKNSKILNVSTTMNYHIVNNDTRIYKDNQLGMFKEIYAHANSDRTLVAKELKRVNIKYVLVNLQAASIDITPDKSLTKKFDDLMNSMVNNPEVKLLYTNRLVTRPDGDLQMNVNGEMLQVKYDVVGASVMDPGTVALFEIL